MNSSRLALVAAALVVAAAAFFAFSRGGRDEESEQDADEPVVAASRVREGPEGMAVVLDSSESARIGIRVLVLGATAESPRSRHPGTVLEEPERTAVLRAPLAGRLAVPSGRTWPRLGDRLEQGREVAQVSDARPLESPLTGVVTAVGARPGELVAAGQMLLTLVDRSQPLVRVVWDPRQGDPPRRLELEPPGRRTRVGAGLVGPSSEADPLTRRPAYLYRADRGWPGSTAGTAVVALARSDAPGVRGAMVPDAGVVQWDGLAWAYRRRGADTYERIRVPTDRPVEGGWLATSGFAAGDTVVVTGAQELLSEEFRARVTVGDESGE
jgi:biotin carboxyl carrier protein